MENIMEERYVRAKSCSPHGIQKTEEKERERRVGTTYILPRHASQ
jgi:hypothetical protein